MHILFDYTPNTHTLLQLLNGFSLAAHHVHDSITQKRQTLDENTHNTHTQNVQCSLHNARDDNCVEQVHRTGTAADWTLNTKR